MTFNQYPSDEEARALIVEVGKRMYQKNHVAANDGNITCKVSDDILWATPTGVSKGFMSESELVKMDINGRIIEKGNKLPSSEIKMHLRIYRENSEIRGITHAHPPYSTAFAIAGLPLDRPIYPEAFVNLGVVPCVHYETPGTDGISDSVAPYCKDYHALLLANHGAVTWGDSLMDAFYRLESMEHYAMILMLTDFVLKKANMLSQGQMADLIDIRKSMGRGTKVVPFCPENPVNNKDVVCSEASKNEP